MREKVVEEKWNSVLLLLRVWCLAVYCADPHMSSDRGTEALACTGRRQPRFLLAI